MTGQIARQLMDIADRFDAADRSCLVGRDHLAHPTDGEGIYLGDIEGGGASAVPFDQYQRHVLAGEPGVVKELAIATEGIILVLADVDGDAGVEDRNALVGKKRKQFFAVCGNGHIENLLSVRWN